MQPNLSPLLARWPEGRQVASVEPVAETGFSGADVFRVRTESGNFALRRWPDDSLHTARIRELHRFLRFLQHNGIDFVAVPCADESGATVVPFEGSRWQLEPWMPGSAISRHSPQDRIASAMRALAKLHLAAARYEPTETGRQWFYASLAERSPAVIERRSMIRDWSESRVRVVAAAATDAMLRPIAARLAEYYTRVAPVIAGELESCAALRFHLHPCLRDLHRDHVLLTGTDVTGIIDPSAARSESVASDLSRLLGSLLGNDEGNRWKEALGAYSAVRPLSEAERRLIYVLDRSGVLLSGLTWVQRSAERALQPLRALSRSVEVHQRLQALAESIVGL